MLARLPAQPGGLYGYQPDGYWPNETAKTSSWGESSRGGAAILAPSLFICRITWQGGTAQATVDIYHPSRTCYGVLWRRREYSPVGGGRLGHVGGRGPGRPGKLGLALPVCARDEQHRAGAVYSCRGAANVPPDCHVCAVHGLLQPQVYHDGSM